MKGFYKSLVKVGLSLSVFGLVACDYQNNNEIVVEDNGYTFHTTYEKDEENIKIEITDDGEVIKTFNFPYYSSLEEDEDADDLLAATNIKTGFGYYPEGDYWGYVCPQKLVDGDVVNSKKILLESEQTVPVQEMFWKKIENAILLEDELKEESVNKMKGLSIAISQALETFIEPAYFTGVAISYFESLGYEYNPDGIEAEYIEVNKDLAELFIRLENKYEDE